MEKVISNVSLRGSSPARGLTAGDKNISLKYYIAACFSMELLLHFSKYHQNMSISNSRKGIRVLDCVLRNESGYWPGQLPFFERIDKTLTWKRFL
jgi:hypothetical protein